MLRQEEDGGEGGEAEDGAQSRGQVEWPPSEVDQEIGEAERGHQPDEADDDGWDVGWLGQGAACVTLALAQTRHIVVFDSLSMENFPKYFDDIASDDCGTTELLYKAKMRIYFTA